MHTVGLPRRVVLVVSLIALTPPLAEAAGRPSTPFEHLFTAPDLRLSGPVASSDGSAAPRSSDEPLGTRDESLVTITVTPADHDPAVRPPALIVEHIEALRTTRRRPHGAAMLSLYGSMVTLQALDAHSTLRALDAGHVEANPMMRWVTGHPAALIGVKAAATAGMVYCAEKIRARHPKRAIAFLAVVNTVYAAVVAHNYRVANQK